LIETALAITLWALSFIFIKIALQEVTPFTVITVRFAMGALVVGAAAGLRGDFARMRRSDLLRMAMLGTVGISLQQLLQVSGQVTADAGVAAFLASTAPAFMVVLAAVFLRERIHRWQAVGVLVATAGAGMVSTGGDLAGLLQGRFGAPGNLLVLASAVMWAVFTILTRWLVQGRPPTLITSGMLAFGWVFMLPLFYRQGGLGQLIGLSSTTWWALIFTGVLSTAGAYLLYSHALKQAEASRLAAIQNIEPVIALVAAALILQEVVTVALLVGGAAIISGVYLAERNAPRNLEKFQQTSMDGSRNTA
jgi:drug/metabolite transporter (DMT)-like permease